MEGLNVAPAADCFCRYKGESCERKGHPPRVPGIAADRSEDEPSSKRPCFHTRCVPSGGENPQTVVKVQGPVNVASALHSRRPTGLRKVTALSH